MNRYITYKIDLIFHRKVTFLPDCVGPDVEAACANPEPGKLLLYVCMYEECSICMLCICMSNVCIYVYTLYVILCMYMYMHVHVHICTQVYMYMYYVHICT